MFTALRRTVLLLTGVLGVLTIALPARVQAQAQSNPGASELQEVVVTARRREEVLLDAPVTVDAFNQQAIQSAGITAPRDFVALVPNMTMVEVQNVGNSFITIRGISQARNSEPSVAVVVDGVVDPNPYEFNEELNDVTSIQVIKGPQGALYGRNAIGGAIIINTAEPSDQFEGAAKVGLGNGPSERAQLALGGPITSDGTLKYRASLSYFNTDGYLENTYLNTKADPYKEFSGRLRFLWKPNDALTADLRFFGDYVDTTAYYYIIPRDNEANPFSSFTTPPNANDVTSPIQTNNLGTDNRSVNDIALKLDYAAGGAGTFTSITDWDHTKEIDTGDAYDFRPLTTSIAWNCPLCFVAPPGPTAAQGGPFDLSQSQFIDVTTWSQEFRFTSNKIGGFAWIAGVYYLHTARFISTDNIFDRGEGVPRVYHTPIVDPTNPYATNTNETFLADSQDNNAWAVYGDATYDFNPEWQLDVALRYDQADVQNTTDTPTDFLPAATRGTAYTGQVRKETFDAVQPKFTLRYKPISNITLYGGWGRGFRSGGFNQTGVGAVAAAAGQLGVHDVFQAEIADTWEVGFKGEFLDRRLGVNLAAFDTKSTNGYFFYFDATTSTQNLGNLDATYKGLEAQLSYVMTSWLDVYAGYGYTDGKITGMEDPTVIGNRPPLLTLDTVNAGFQVHAPIASGLSAVLRLDYQLLGRTWWDPKNVTSRDPVNLLDLRAGLEGERWAVTAWSKNLTNTQYNEEFSPGGFLWRALPRRYGVDFRYKF